MFCVWILVLVCGCGAILALTLRGDMTKKRIFSDQFNYHMKTMSYMFADQSAAAEFR